MMLLQVEAKSGQLWLERLALRTAALITADEWMLTGGSACFMSSLGKESDDSILQAKTERDVGLVEKWKLGMHSNCKNIKTALWFFTYILQSETQITFICPSQLTLPRFKLRFHWKASKKWYIFWKGGTHTQTMNIPKRKWTRNSEEELRILTFVVILEMVMMMMKSSICLKLFVWYFSGLFAEGTLTPTGRPASLVSQLLNFTRATGMSLWNKRRPFCTHSNQWKTLQHPHEAHLLLRDREMDGIQERTRV